ncbi:MAG: DUF488 domain-containing protein [Patescibacteria group bacterium]|nr:DUF488 domain-containing protein [Patescibacteria group bacterium]
MNITIKRIYEKSSTTDGKRVLIDRLWPRGLTKEKAKIDVWLKDIAPSTELREWFGHDPVKWSEFKKRYLTEIKSNSTAMSQLEELLKKGKVTLVYAAKDKEYNDAVVLQEYLGKK